MHIRPYLALALSASLIALTQLPNAARAENIDGLNWSGSSATFFVGNARSKTVATDLDNFALDSPPNNVMSLASTNGYWGLAFGHDFQRGNLVYGGAVELGQLNAGEIFVNDDGYGISTEFNEFYSLSGRLGYASNRTLYYARLGIALASIRSAAGEYDGDPETADTDKWAFDDGESGRHKGTETGYLLGLGVEHRLQGNLSLTGEYNYADFGRVTYTNESGEAMRFKNDLHLFKLGLTYRF